jgi:hypothetical protein
LRKVDMAKWDSETKSELLGWPLAIGLFGIALCMGGVLLMCLEAQTEPPRDHYSYLALALGLLLCVCRKDLPQFRQYQMPELLALVVCLGSAAGIAFRFYGVGERPVVISAFGCVASIVLWMAVIGALNKKRVSSRAVRMLVVTAALIAMGVGWITILRFAEAFARAEGSAL